MRTKNKTSSLIELVVAANLLHREGECQDYHDDSQITVT